MTTTQKLEALCRNAGWNVSLDTSCVGILVSSSERSEAEGAAREVARAARLMFEGVSVCEAHEEPEEDDDRRWSTFVKVPFLG